MLLYFTFLVKKCLLDLRISWFSFIKKVFQSKIYAIIIKLNILKQLYLYTLIIT